MPGQNEPYRNILIIKPSSLGDIVHALPVLPALRKAFPSAQITWMIQKNFAPLLSCVSQLNHICIFDRKRFGSWWYNPFAFSDLCKFVHSLNRRKFDLVLDLQGLLRSALFARITSCPQRIGLSEAREGSVVFYTRKVPPPESVHIIDYYKEVLWRLDVQMNPADLTITPPRNAESAVQTLLDDHELVPGKFAVLIPGSMHQSKCWPAERFARIAEFLHTSANLKIVAAGVSSEQFVIDQISRMSSVPIVSFAGKTTIPQLAALFSRAAFVVGNDTGPSHLAAAMNIPSVVIFGHTNPARLGPYNKPDCIAAVDPFGRGRAIDSPDPRYRIENVTVEMVLQKIRIQLGLSESLNP